MILFNIWLIFITIPRTVIGISAPNFDSAPYFPSVLFSVAITNTILIWFIKLLIPNIETFFATFAFTLNASLLNLIDLNFLTYNAFSINTKIWLITVAIAAPSTPILNTNINIGSNIVFNTAPTSIVVIEYFGLPSDLIIEFNVVPIIENGNPIAIT